MDKQIKNVFNNVKYGNNLEESIPEYLTYLSGLYRKLSEVNLSMNYYILYENYIDTYHRISKQDLEILNRLNALIYKSMFKVDKFTKAESLKEINKIRDYIIEQMKILTNFTDILLVYEYVLKRIEYRFIEFEDTAHDLDDTALTNQIVDYIFEVQDQVVIKNKISEVISALPVRMTKFKYLDLVNASFSLYEKQAASSLESYLYMIRSSAMLYKIEGMEEKYPQFNSFIKVLKATNFEDLNKEEWKKLQDEFDTTIVNINDLSNYFYDLQEIVNLFYAYLLSTNENSPIDNIQNPLFEIIKIINNNFQNKVLEINEETQDLLIHTEGVQEEVMDKINSYESVFSKIQNKYGNTLRKLQLEEKYKDLQTCQKLFSTSLFFEFDGDKDSRILSKEEVDQEKTKLLTELEDLLKNNSRYVNRAIMANTLGKIPGFLSSTEEVIEYIKSSLVQCRDEAEKRASINTIRSFWE